LVAQRGQTESERGRAERVGERGVVGAMAAFSAYRILVAETNGSNLARARQIFRCRLKSCRSFPLPIVGDSRRYAHSLTRHFPRRVQHLIPAIRSGFFRVRAESLVHG